ERGDGRRFRHQRQSDRLADGDHAGCEQTHHDRFLSFLMRSISDRSASTSSSLHEPSRTSAATICANDPPKKVCTTCCSAVCFAAAGEIVAEYINRTP